METPTGSSRQAALERVKVPAICMIVLGVLYELAALWGIIASALGLAMPGMGGQEEEQMAGFLKIYQSMGVVFGVIGIAFATVILVGGLKLMKLQSPGLVKTGAVLGMIPISCCCVLGLPLGIWVFLVTSKPEVAAEFNRPGAT